MTVLVRYPLMYRCHAAIVPAKPCHDKYFTKQSFAALLPTPVLTYDNQ